MPELVPLELVPLELVLLELVLLELVPLELVPLELVPLELVPLELVLPEPVSLPPPPPPPQAANPAARAIRPHKRPALRAIPFMILPSRPRLVAPRALRLSTLDRDRGSARAGKTPLIIERDYSSTDLAS